MATVATQNIKAAWDERNTFVPVSPIRNERQYDRAVKKLNELLDIVGDDERHPLYDLLDTLGTIIHAYEESHYPEPQVAGTDVLKYLMEEHRLSPASFAEIGSADVVADLLEGKRELSVDHIRQLSKRFGLSPATFI
ncbi:MAG: type II toxin-antitoxin system HigA family antitoxin [bacterium]